MFTRKPLAVCIATALTITSFSSLADLNAAQTDPQRKDLERIEIKGNSNVNDPFPFNVNVVEEGKILAGKKVSVIDLELQPTFVEPNLRQVFSRLPGLFVSDQKIPSIYNVNYRGLGNPHESEFVAFYQNGIPLASDMFGYATIYYLPPAQRIERAEFIRGGAGLLYGPQIGPTINFVTKRASANVENSASTEHSIGSDGFYSTYNEVQYAQGDFGFMASFDHRQSDGPRENEDSEVNSGYFGIAYNGFEDIRIGFDLDVYQSDSGEAGRLSSSEFASNRDLVKTPFNRIEIERVIASLTYDQQLSNDATLNGKVWYSYQDRFSRRSSAFVAPAAEPSTTNIDQQEFTTFGLDVRFAQAWGGDNIFTLGTTMYTDDSPRTRHVSDNIRSNVQLAEDLLFEQDRVMTYSALFVENLFRFGNLSIVPTARYERVNYDLSEPLKRASLQRDAIDVDKTNNELLMGLGASYRLSDTTELYANISESYRPQRFDDLANPNAELTGENGPDISKAENMEFGVRSMIVEGFNLDVSLFRIDFNDKVEQIQVNIVDIQRVNTGNSKHQGIEFSAEYDFFYNRNDDSNFIVFVNGSLLEAEITESTTASLVGNTPSFAPDYLIRAGFIYNQENLSVALTATFVDQQFWQDSNLSRGSGAGQIDGVIPSYEVFDLSAEYQIDDSWSLQGGVNNLFDDDYYSRIRNDGIEPAAERTAYVGFRYQF
ncbi:TonB-dependent receptor [Glaciecola sp. XM2]|uniref:TonB-dependent receptor family protein n=1 Tax=Glaciecola sp. XM2 TaxID=1914931 RepID=UPI001BDEA5BC|nr:TonB-dependent receptor [Glaciecola sp. XM2]MBT1450552.1 TonB-dependent receptor [Glaciecola sp. XM2]